APQIAGVSPVNGISEDRNQLGRWDVATDLVGRCWIMQILDGRLSHGSFRCSALKQGFVIGTRRDQACGERSTPRTTVMRLPFRMGKEVGLLDGTHEDLRVLPQPPVQRRGARSSRTDDQEIG